MCGILGFITSNPSVNNAKYLKKILYLSAIRGTDATGIAYVKDGKVIIEKDSIDANEFIKGLLSKHELELTNAHIALGHTRTPTVGTPKDNNNNHPLESDRWILIHNGSVSGMTRLKDYKYKGEVDSEILLSYVQEYGLEKGLPHVGKTGTAAVALIDKEDPNAIYLWRETHPIKLAYDEQSETIFFASEENFLIKSLTNKLHFFSTFQFRDLPENLLIKITTNPLDIVPINYVTVISPPVTSTGTVHTIPYTSYKNYGYSMPASTLGLQFDKTIKRWEKKVEVKQDPSLKSIEPSMHTLLTELGYTDDQIGKLSETTISTIIYSSIQANQISILPNGMLQFNPGQIAGSSTTLKNKYYIRDKSRDFKGWYKLTPPNRGYISLDGELIKKWDKTVEQHYITMLGDAIKEKLVDDIALQGDLDDMFGYSVAELEARNNVPKELMS